MPARTRTATSDSFLSIANLLSNRDRLLSVGQRKSSQSPSLSRHPQREEFHGLVNLSRTNETSILPAGEPGSVAQVGVPLQECYVVDHSVLEAGVAQDVEPIPDVHDEDESVANDWEAPHDHFVRASAQSRIFERDRVERCWREPARLRRPLRIGDLDCLKSTRVPGIEYKLREHERVVG